MLLNLLVLYTFIIALFKKIDNFAKREPVVATSILPSNISTTPFDSTFTTTMDSVTFPIVGSMENAITDAVGSLVQGTAAIFTETVPDLTSMLSTNVTYCYQVAVNCSKASQFNRTMVTSLFFLNFTTTILPKLSSHLNDTNDFSMSSSPSSTMAYTDETFDWMDYNTTSTDYDYNSSTTMTATAIDFFNDSTTDAYDTTTMDDITTNTETNSSDRDYYLETADDFYDYEDLSRRRRKKRSDGTLIDYYNYDEGNEVNIEDEIATTIDDTNTNINVTFTTIIFDDYTSTNESTEVYNRTEFISSTIESFVENITSTEWPDEMNTTYASELWTEYLTTLNSSLTEDYDVDENDPDEKCFVERCEVIEKGAGEGDTTTSVPSTTINTTMKSTTKATTPMPTIQQPLPSAPTCPPVLLFNAISDLLPSTMSSGNGTRHDNLTGLNVGQEKYCWETMFGQELVKLTVLDLVSVRYSRWSLSINHERIFSALHNRFDALHGLFSRIICAFHEQMLVLGFGEEISEIR